MERVRLAASHSTNKKVADLLLRKVMRSHFFGFSSSFQFFLSLHEHGDIHFVSSEYMRLDPNNMFGNYHDYDEASNFN